MSTEISINPPELGIARQSTWHRPLGVIGRKYHPGEGKDVQRPYLRTIGLHAVEVAFSGAAWFVAVMWLNSIGGPQLGLTLAIGTGTMVMFATLLLLAISMPIDDARSEQPRVDSPALYRTYPHRQGHDGPSSPIYPTIPSHSPSDAPPIPYSEDSVSGEPLAHFA